MATTIRVPGADELPVDLPPGLDPDRARLAWRRLRTGTDGRLLIRLPAARARVRGTALVAAVAAVATAASPLPVFLAGLPVAVAATRALVVAGRADAARRRLRQALEAAAACDRRHGVATTDRRLEVADGDLLRATRLLGDHEAVPARATTVVTAGAGGHDRDRTPAAW